MSATAPSGQGEPLNESWVELSFQQQQASQQTNNGSDMRPMAISVHSGSMEKLLLEAQKESSRSSSRASSSINSSRGSPKSPPSPNNEHQELQSTDWIWDWSSRPEVQPPSDWGIRFKHPGAKRNIERNQVRKTGLFSLENLPVLLFTHACTFLVGGAVVAAAIFCLKRCPTCALRTVSIIQVD